MAQVLAGQLQILNLGFCLFRNDLDQMARNRRIKQQLLTQMVQDPHLRQLQYMYVIILTKLRRFFILLMLLRRRLEIVVIHELSLEEFEEVHDTLTRLIKLRAACIHLTTLLEQEVLECYEQQYKRML